MSSIVVPSSRRDRISDQNWRRASGSKPVVGSSRNSSRGPPDDAQRDVEPAALATGEAAPAGARLVGEADQLQHLVGVARVRVVRRPRPQQLPAAELAVPAAALQHDAELRASSAGRAVAGSAPSTCTSPASRRRWPSSTSTVVVLPAPLGPSSAKISPRRMSRSSPSTAAESP